jgi:hypothetical protein
MRFSLLHRPALAHVGDDEAVRGHGQIVGQRIGRDERGNERVAAPEDDFLAHLAPERLGEKRLESGRIDAEALGDGMADDVFRLEPQHLAQPSVGVEHGAVGRDGRRTLSHRLDEDPVRAIRLLERVNTVRVRLAEHEGVDLARSNGPDDLVGFGKLATEIGDVGFGAHVRGSLTGRRSSPTSVRSESDRSPMIFFMGEGSLRTKVGIARI